MRQGAAIRRVEQGPVPPSAPGLRLINGASAQDQDQSASARAPLAIRAAHRLREPLDRLIARCSLVPDDPVLDVRDFGWTQSLRDGWQAIRGEIGQHDCPATRSLLARIPGLHDAFFSTLDAGAHVPARRGITKGLLTCHLGLAVPRDGDVRMRVDDRVVRWAEGETLLFDDSREHEMWNESAHARVALTVQVRRPLHGPGRWVADKLLDIVRGAQPAGPVLARIVNP